MGDAEGALSSLERAGELNPFQTARRDVLRARAEAQLGHSRQSILQLRRTVAHAEERLWGGIALEAKLALGELELGAGRKEGRQRLLKLEEEARSKGFLRIARLAREALDSKAPRAPGR